MAASTPIPVPLTPEEEEEQIEFAILQSIMLDQARESEDNLWMTHSQCVSAAASETINGNTRGVEERSSPTGSSGCSPHVPANTSMSSRRSPTTISNTPDVSERSARSISPERHGQQRRNTNSRNCCKVRDDILLGHILYIEQLEKEIQSTANPPVHMAIRNNHFECIEEIIKEFPEVLDTKNVKGDTPLYVAVSQENILMTRRLIAAGVNLNCKQRNRDTPLQAAVERDNETLCSLLLKNGANPNLGMNRSWTAVHECVDRGNTRLLETLLRHGASPNVRDTYGVSPVFSGAACGRNECLKILLAAGGDPNLCASTKVASPLYEACKKSHQDCALTLLKYAADPHISNCENLYPIHMACKKGLVRVVEELVKVTDKDMVENCGKSPLHFAAEENELEILEILIENGYDVDVKIAKSKISFRDRRQTALFFAVDNDSEEATATLLKAGAQTDLDYVKPLLVAESHRQYNIVDMLIASGADINATFAEEGMIFPATIAFAIRDNEMFRKILLAGCDVARCFECPFEDADHTIFSEEEQKKSFCYFLGLEQNIQWAGWTLVHLLGFVDNVTLCQRMRDILLTTEHWNDIALTVGQPRSLTHLCRLKIRRTAKTILFDRTDVPLPKPLLDYLNHKPF